MAEVGKPMIADTIIHYSSSRHTAALSTLDIGPDIGIANLAIIRSGPPKRFDDLGQSFASNWLVDGWIQARAALLTAPCL